MYASFTRNSSEIGLVMNGRMNKVDPFPILIPLSEETQKLARQFALEQTTIEKSKQVYFNTLAVLAVKHFLQWMKIDTDLHQSESWNRIIRTFHDVADLSLCSFGRLECRPILPEKTSIDLPTEIREDRIGCVVVQVCERLNQARLLGCYLLQDHEKELPEHLQVKNLSSLDTLLEQLDWLETLKSWGGLINLQALLRGLMGLNWQTDTEIDLFTQANSAVSFRRIAISNHQENIKILIKKLHSNDKLSRQKAAHKLGESGVGNSDAIAALTQQLETENDENTRWQAAMSLAKIAPGHPKSGVRVRKLINLGKKLSVALVMSCRQDLKHSMRVCVRVCPTNSQIHLPVGCKLTILDEFGQEFGEKVKAVEQDDYLQKCLSVDPGDRFGVKIELDNVSYTEHFVG